MGKSAWVALRTLGRSPGFTAVVVITLALGIGANTAIFSVVNGVLLQPLPYPDSDELVAVWADFSERGGPDREWLSYPNFADLRDESSSLAALAVYGGWGPTHTGSGETERLQGAQVTHGMFGGVLGVSPAVGRGFEPAEDEPGAEPVVLLSHGLWVRRLGADPEIVGSSLDLDGEPHTVVGVMPEGFRPPFILSAELWRPLRQGRAENCGRACVTLRGVGRLADGTGLEAARSELATLSRRLEESHPDANGGVRFYPVDLREDVIGDTATPLWILLGAVGFVLLIACVNVANLMLARGSARRGERAVRAALGASRSRIAGEVLVESLVLAALGAGAGLILAFWGTDFLVSRAPAGIPRLDEVGVELPVLLFTGLVTVAAGLLFGLLPASTAARRDLNRAISGSGRGGAEGPGSGRTRRILVAGQVALALVLLVGAGLLLRSLESLDRADLGFEPERILTLSLNLPTTRYQEGADRTAFYGRLVGRIAAMPDVEAAGAVSSLPMSGFNSDVGYTVEGEPPPPPDRPQTVWIRPVTPGYLDAMGIELVDGRGIRESDGAEAPGVIVINETLARRHFAGRDPLGRAIDPGSPGGDSYRIVGVAENVKNFGIREDEPPAAYLSHAQVPFTAMFVVARARGEPQALIPAVRRTIGELDPELAASRIEPMGSVVRGSLARERFTMTLLGLFAALALVLASVGIYGIVAHGVSRRRREMGIRIAVGARPGRVAGLVVREGLLVCAVGVATGVLGALALSRLLEGLLYEVSPGDPLTYGAVSLVLVGVAVAASWIPARRAAGVDPVQVLRVE